MNKIGALWSKTSNKGMNYFSGIINDKQIVIFKVKEKKSEKSPDYEIFLSEPRQTAAAVEQKFSGAPPSTEDDDIPFS